MATKKVTDFFKNKVSIRLKTGQQFRGLLSKIDNKNATIVLQDIQDLGNAYDKQQLPHDKKIAQKTFEADNIEEIVINDRVFADPKKYNPDDFFDSMTEHKDKFRQKGDDRQNRDRNKRGGYRGRGGNTNEYRDKRQDRPKRNYQAKQQRRGPEDDDRQYR